MLNPILHIVKDGNPWGRGGCWPSVGCKSPALLPGDLSVGEKRNGKEQEAGSWAWNPSPVLCYRCLLPPAFKASEYRVDTTWGRFSGLLRAGFQGRPRVEWVGRLMYHHGPRASEYLWPLWRQWDQWLGGWRWIRCIDQQDWLQVLIKPHLLSSVSWHKHLVWEMERTPYMSWDLAGLGPTPMSSQRAWEVRGLRGIRVKGKSPHPQVAKGQIPLWTPWQHTTYTGRERGGIF